MYTCILQTKYKLVLPIAIALTFLISACSKENKVYRVGILSGLDFFKSTIDGFKSKMKDLGYIEGENINYDIYTTNFNIGEEKRILRKLIENKPDLIFTFPTEVSISAKKEMRGSNIPLLFANAIVEGTVLINSIKEPGGNTTGIRYPGLDISLKRFEVLHELIPKAKKILIPYQRNYPTVAAQLDLIKLKAGSLNIKLIEAPASGKEEIEEFLTRQSKTALVGINAILLIAEPLGVNPEIYIQLGRFADKHKIPICGAIMFEGKDISLFGVATENISVGKQAAILADKIFKGINPGKIPVVSAENYLRINYRVIRKFNIKISEGLLRQANEIIK
jgi:putative tryptophan/tyrosine transport system substrate-binding protein